MTRTSDPDVMNVSEAVSVAWRSRADGERLTFVDRETGADTIVEYQRDGSTKEVVAFDETISGRAGTVQWAHDGHAVTYVRDGQIRVYDTDEETEITPAPSRHFDSAPRWSPDDERLAFISNRHGGATDVFTVSPDGGEPDRVTENANREDEIRFAPAWGPDGDAIAFVGAHEWNGYDWGDDAHVAYLSGGEERLTTGLSLTSAPTWSPDGRRLAFFALRPSEPWYRNSESLYVYDVTTGRQEEHDVRASHFGSYAQQPMWDGSGEKIYYVVQNRGRQQIESVLLNGGDARGVTSQLTTQTGTFGRSPVRISSDGDKIGYVYSEFTRPLHPRQIETRGGSATVCQAPTRVDDALVPENVTYESFDGLYVNAYVYRPESASAETPTPALVQCHGGAHYQYGDGWHALEQYLAANDFTVIAIDYRGSGGYGRAFQELSMGDWEGGEVRDIREAARFARDLPYTTDDVGIYGGSWGGYMTLHSITQYPDVWDAAVEWYGVLNQFTDYEDTDRVGRRLSERDLNGTPEDAEQAYHDASIHWRLDEISTPLAVLHGEEDQRVPVGQAREIQAAVEEKDIDFRMSIFEEEGHGFQRAGTRRTAARETLEWFQKHLVTE
jgi:dipeptidyl aminopeptidase/acylaminoacyl peptidase